MEEDRPSPGRRKLRFAPKAPQPSRKPKLAIAKTETFDEDTEAAQAQYLLGRFNDNLTRQLPKVDKRSSVQVAIGPGAPSSSSSLRTFGTSDSTPKQDWTTEAAPKIKIKGEYSQPWEQGTYHPITLPLRRPCSGDPELVDEAEFGEAASKEYDEGSINPAKDLALLEEAEKEKLFFFQLPTNLPTPSSKGKEKAETGRQLEELPAGHVGKMLVYKSGAVKLKMGETLFDVWPGTRGVFDQNVAVINTRDKQCCIIGDLAHKAVVTLDIDTTL